MRENWRDNIKMKLQNMEIKSEENPSKNMYVYNYIQINLFLNEGRGCVPEQNDCEFETTGQ